MNKTTFYSSLHRPSRSSSSGMSLVEMLIALAVLATIITTVGLFEVNVFRYQRSTSASLETIQNAQVILKTMLSELRETAPGANGAYPIVTAGSTTLSFFSNPTNASQQQITYSLIGTTLYRSVISPAGSPPSYNPASQSTTTLLFNVRNGSSTPIFQYYDTNYSGTSSPLVQPIPVTAVRLIKISLTLDTNPNIDPGPVTYTVQASLRNLKSNL